MSTVPHCTETAHSLGYGHLVCLNVVVTILLKARTGRAVLTEKRWMVRGIPWLRPYPRLPF
jgi:hypothetical protein